MLGYITKINVTCFYFTFFNAVARKFKVTYVAYVLFLLEPASLEVLQLLPLLGVLGPESHGRITRLSFSAWF